VPAPKIDQLYPGVDLDFTRRILRKLYQHARLWKQTHTTAYVLVWPKGKDTPELRLYPLDVCRISQNPTQSPPMPKWTGVETPWIRPLNVGYPSRMLSFQRNVRRVAVP
jgi:hypothetical protein